MSNSFGRKMNNLFFIKRRPSFHIPAEWEPPKSRAEYEQLEEYEGFIVKSAWQHDDLDKFPTVKQDLADLEEHLLPTFWEFNQKARHYQNRFYFYQWVFMLGAFLTTLLGALTTYAYTFTEDSRAATITFGVLTAAVSAVTAYFNVLSDQGSPQKRWANTRRLSEELRMMYYRYLAHLPPFDKEDRLDQMRRLVLQVRRKENENV